MVPLGTVAFRQHCPKNDAFSAAMTDLLVVGASGLCTLLPVAWGRGMSSLKSLVFDLFLVALATIAASITRENFEIVDAKLIALVPYLAITVSGAGVILPALGIHRSAWQFTSLRDCLRIAAATVAVVLSAVAIGFLVNRLDGVARALPLISGSSNHFISCRCAHLQTHILRSARSVDTSVVT